MKNLKKDYPLVVILMSTYNGEKYIREQIDSILNQKNVQVKIIIRDDGSTDNTVEIIQNEYPEIELIIGENVGYKLSFHMLMSNAPDAEYYAFSDQDDYWYENKLIKAIDIVKKHKEVPFFYFSNLEIVDSKLERIGFMYKGIKKLDKYCTLVENLSYGCTILFNHKMLKIAKTSIPQSISHDGWINLIGAFFGKYYYDPNAYIKYRQHSTNVLGGDRRFFSVWKKRLSSFKCLNCHIRDVQALEFLSAFREHFTNEEIEEISRVAFYRKGLDAKIKLLLYFKIHMSTFDRDFWYRMRIIFSNI